MGKILVFCSLCAFIPFAHSGTWMDARTKFNDLHENSLLDSARQIIRSHCGGSWMDNLMGLTDNGSYLRSLRKCEGFMTENEHTLKGQEYILFENQTSRDKWKKIFPEYEEDIQNLSQAIEKHKRSDYFSYIKAHPKADSSGSVSDEEKEASEILLKSSFIGLFKED